MFFILLFLATSIGVFLYIRTSQDIYGVLAVGMAIVCLIWGLVIAHWSLHLLALLALFCCRKYFSLATTSLSNK